MGFNILLLAYSILVIICLPQAETVVLDIYESVNQVNISDWPYVHMMSSLETYIFKNYSTNIRPVKNFFTPTKVFLFPLITHIKQFDQKQEKIGVTGSLYMEWVDEHLQWNKEEYSGINRIVTHAYNIWKPTLIVFNAVGNISTPSLELGSRVFLHANGRVLWYPSFVFEASCNMDFSKFPYDTHECPIIVGPWSYSNTEIEFELFTDKPEVFLAFNDTKTVVSGWKLENVSSRLGWWNAVNQSFQWTKPSNYANNETIHTFLFPFVELAPKLKRFSNYFGVAIKMPTIVASLTNLFVFMVQDFPMKIILLTGNLMLQMCFFDDLANILPNTSDSMPGIVTYFGFNLIITVFSLALTIALAALAKLNERKAQVPDFLLILNEIQIMRNCASKFCSVGVKRSESASDEGWCEKAEGFDESEEKLSKSITGINRWPDIAENIQLIFFIIYSILYAIFYIIFL